MSGALLLVVFLAVALVWVSWWLVADWRRDVRGAKAVGRTAQAAIAEMGRHNLPESEERTEPTFAEALTLLPIGEEPPRRSRHVPVQDLLARLQDEGSALRLNWRHEDEQRARRGDCGIDPGDFPTAVLPVVPSDEP
ncbi:hypothetical protein JOF56_004178 [Kibdelosporangium banguiense]|uniref:Flp pilus-assembly TadE/G-like n=1 Tax=Kibdelosporangium banguiense TaxID=1365924 RepID=A0ABS4TH86_9PSEU|nr:hypothetical protein [Kibdelosporangium banguiense]MBP2323793.1 hypothetical protein [Kibdelosporangium banguiense]